MSAVCALMRICPCRLPQDDTGLQDGRPHGLLVHVEALRDLRK